MKPANAVRESYVGLFGQPSRNASFEVGPYRIEVFKWDAELTHEGVAIYATLGASEWTVAGIPETHRDRKSVV